VPVHDEPAHPQRFPPAVGRTQVAGGRGRVAEGVGDGRGTDEDVGLAGAVSDRARFDQTLRERRRGSRRGLAKALSASRAVAIGRQDGLTPSER
jgi:hypothetical protein